MKTLVLTGNDRRTGNRSGTNNTMKLTEAFLQGIRRHLFFTTGKKSMAIEKAQVEPCKGCNSCWQNTPGKCGMVSEEQNVHHKFLNADLVVWSFPLYYYGPPSILKAFVGIQPKKKSILPTFGKKQKPQEQRHVLIAACSFDSAGANYDTFFKQFDSMYFDRNVKILCSQGELLSVPQMQARTDKYLEFVRKAGVEFAATGKFTPETVKRLSLPLFKKTE